MSPTISIIAALDENRGIGMNNKLLWHIPTDMKHFRLITTGHVVIMGRKTFESIGKPLPKRTNIVITTNKNRTFEGCITCHSLEEALQEGKKYETEEIFIIGGASIYKQAIKLSAKLYLTLVKGTYEADTHFPSYEEFDKILSKQEITEKSYTFTFLELAKNHD